MSTTAKKIVCEEYYDTDVLKKLLKSTGVVDEDSMKSLKYLRYKKLKGSSSCAVTYMHKAGGMRKKGMGRLYPQSFSYAQGMSRALRNSLARSQYWDVDMVSSQPTLALAVCKQKGWDCEALEDYIEHRDEWLEKLGEYYGVPAKDPEGNDAKSLINSVCFGMALDNWQARVEEARDGWVPRDVHHKSIVTLKQEMKVLGMLIMAEYPEVVKDLKSDGKEPWYGSVAAFVLQDMETQVLVVIRDFLLSRGRSMDTLIHDGGLVRKLPGEKEFPEGLLREVEEHVYHEFPGLEVRLAVKAMDEVFSLEGNDVHGNDGDDGRSNPVYIAWKEEIEMEWAFVMQPPTYVRLYSDGREPYLSTASKFKESYQHSPTVSVGPTKISCHVLWMSDPDKRCFERMVFRPPPLATTSKDFNLWTGFAVESIPSSKEGSPDMMLKHIKMLCGDAYDYCIKWIARIFQRPGASSRTALAFCGEQGIGKNLVTDFLNYLLGDKLYFKTSSPDSVVFGRFNSAMMYRLLVNIDEAAKSKMVAGKEQLKDMIANKKISVEKKGIDAFILDSFVAFILTTNNIDSVPLEVGDRRYVVVSCSDQTSGNTAYFNTLVDYMENPANQRAFYDYLLTVDLNGIDWIKDRPNGALYNHMQVVHSDVFSKFWMHIYAKFQDDDLWSEFETWEYKTATEFYEAYAKYETGKLKMESASVKSNREWGTLLLTKNVIRKHDDPLTDKLEFVLWKTRTGNAKKYIIDKALLGKWLVNKKLLDVTDIECAFTEEEVKKDLCVAFEEECNV